MPITAQSLIAQTGRENGPDFVLKPIYNPIAGGAITANSNITEVLNVIAYLCNPVAPIGAGPAPRTDAVIDTDQSVSPIAGMAGAVGQHGNNGQYAQPDGAGASADSLWLDGAGAATLQMIDLDTFLPPAAGYAANDIPQGILTRAPLAAPALLGVAHATVPIAILAAGAPALPADTTTELSCAVKQMINILENTRKIFGPKGWTALFSQVKGGGGGSKHAKRTHRQHRRRYSSKHY
jgi:hypothetical protein